jgi:AcrR family transcriptional regulator
MVSLRKGDVREFYLDAARSAIVDVGLRRLTMIEVARRAGVSRMTLYRVWPDADRMVADLMTREWESVVAEQEGHDANAVDRLVHVLVGASHSMRHNDLYRRIMQLDRESVLPYMLDRRGRTQNLILRLTREAIIDGQGRGEIRDGNPDVIARAILLATQGFVLTMGTMLDGASEAELDAEETTLLRRYLVP